MRRLFPVHLEFRECVSICEWVRGSVKVMYNVVASNEEGDLIYIVSN